MRQMDDKTLAKTVNAARELEGISARELARRAGISASQVTRIESGEVKRPAAETVSAIASALGRPRAALDFLAGHANAEEVHDVLKGALDEDEFEAGWPFEKPWPGREMTAADARKLRSLASRAFLAYSLRRVVEEQELADFEAIEPISQLAAAWPALTDARRGRVRGFVEDQVRLSELDRREDERGRS